MTEPKIICKGEIKPGYTGFSRTTGFLGRTIQLGENLKFRDGQYNHAFTVVSTGDLSNEYLIVQATLKGVVLSPLSDLFPTTSEILLLPPPKGVDAGKVVEFAMSEVGSDYGLLSDICIAVDILTWDNWPAVRRPNTWICSALASEALRYGGWLHHWKDIYTVTPTQLKQELIHSLEIDR